MERRAFLEARAEADLAEITASHARVGSGPPPLARSPSQLGFRGRRWLPCLSVNVFVARWAPLALLPQLTPRPPPALAYDSLYVWGTAKFGRIFS